MNVKIIVCAENIIAGILAHVFVRSHQCDGIISVMDIILKKDKDYSNKCFKKFW